MKPFSISHYVKFTCWTSIVLILWGLATDVLQSKFTTWIAFVFFCVVGFLAFIVTRESTK